MSENIAPSDINNDNEQVSPSHATRMAARRRGKMPVHSSPKLMASAIASAPPSIDISGEESPRHIPVHFHPYWAGADFTVYSDEATSTERLHDTSTSDSLQLTNPIPRLPALASIQHRVPSLARVTSVATLGTGYSNTQEPVSFRREITNTQPAEDLPATNIAVTGFLSHLDQLEKDQLKTQERSKVEEELYTDALEHPRFSMADDAQRLLQRANRAVNLATHYYTDLVAWQTSGLAQDYGRDLPRVMWGLHRQDRRARRSFQAEDPRCDAAQKKTVTNGDWTHCDEEEQILNDRQDRACSAAHWNVWIGDTRSEIYERKHEGVNNLIKQTPVPEQLRPDQEEPKTWWYVLGKRSRDYPPEYLASDVEKSVEEQVDEMIRRERPTKRLRLSAPDTIATSLSTGPSVPLSAVSSLSAGPSVPFSNTTSRGASPESGAGDEEFAISISAGGSWVNRFTSQLARAASAAIGYVKVDSNSEVEGNDDDVTSEGSEQSFGEVDADADISQSEDGSEGAGNESEKVEDESANSEDDDKTVVGDFDHAEVTNLITYDEDDSEVEADDDGRAYARNIVLKWSRERFEAERFSDIDDGEQREEVPRLSRYPALPSAQELIATYAHNRPGERNTADREGVLEANVERDAVAEVVAEEAETQTRAGGRRRQTPQPRSG